MAISRAGYHSIGWLKVALVAFANPCRRWDRSVEYHPQSCVRYPVMLASDGFSGESSE